MRKSTVRMLIELALSDNDNALETKRKSPEFSQADIDYYRGYRAALVNLNKVIIDWNTQKK